MQEIVDRLGESDSAAGITNKVSSFSAVVPGFGATSAPPPRDTSLSAAAARACSSASRAWRSCANSRARSSARPVSAPIVYLKREDFDGAALGEVGPDQGGFAAYRQLLET